MSEIVGGNAIAAHLGISEAEFWLWARRFPQQIRRRQVRGRPVVYSTKAELASLRKLVGMEALARNLDISVSRAYDLYRISPLPKDGWNISVTPEELRTRWAKHLKA